MTNSKIQTYLGFCIRARKIAFGTDDLEKRTKGVFLILSDGGLSPNAFKIVLTAKERLNCPLLITEKGLLGELLHRYGVKAVSIKDKNLATAILSAADGESEFKLYSGGNN